MRDAGALDWLDSTDARGNLVHVDLCLEVPAAGLGLLRLEGGGGRQGSQVPVSGVGIPMGSQLQRHPQELKEKEGLDVRFSVGRC